MKCTRCGQEIPSVTNSDGLCAWCRGLRDTLVLQKRIDPALEARFEAIDKHIEITDSNRIAVDSDLWNAIHLIGARLDDIQADIADGALRATKIEARLDDLQKLAARSDRKAFDDDCPDLDAIEEKVRRWELYCVIVGGLLHGNWDCYDLDKDMAEDAMKLTDVAWEAWKGRTP